LGKEISDHITYKLSEEIPMVNSFTVSVNFSKKQTDPLNKFSNSKKNKKEGAINHSKCVGVSGEKNNRNFRSQNLP